MKTPEEVGKNFDEYARQWGSDRYKMETGWDGKGLSVAEGDDTGLHYPGDEWGEYQKLVELYSLLLPKLMPLVGDINVLEIGPGGGRSTQAVLEVLGSRVDEYHVVDVSSEFVKVLQSRIDRPVRVHVVDDVDLTSLPSDHFHLCLAQSSWSHISIYDQYRYIRDLRRVLIYQAPLVVHGQFLLGSGNDWTWNRFRRRVYQIENGIEGVYHEFTGLAAIAEQLTRLEYDVELIHASGFIARRNQSAPDAYRTNLDGPPSYPYLSSLQDYVRGVAPRVVALI